jgi:hypothetical protein
MPGASTPDVVPLPDPAEGFDPVSDPDPWKDCVAGGKDWQLTPIKDRATRPCYNGLCRVSGAEAVVKFDNANARPPQACLREKICCDLAQELCLPTPGALLYKDVAGAFGVAVRRISGISFLLWKKTHELSGVAPVEVARRNYPLSMIAFDWFVGNSDRNLNNGNIVMEGSPSNPRIVPVDFGNTLGTSMMPWDSQYSEGRVPTQCWPLPAWVQPAPSAWQEAVTQSSRLEALKSETIETVVRRAAQYYNLAGSAFEADTLVRLSNRRFAARTWLSGQTL